MEITISDLRFPLGFDDGTITAVLYPKEGDSNPDNNSSWTGLSISGSPIGLDYCWFEADTYRFTVFADDGVRLWVDDQLLIDQWQHPQVATFQADVTLSQGYHRVRLEYYEAWGAAAVHLGWAALQ